MRHLNLIRMFKGSQRKLSPFSSNRIRNLSNGPTSWSCALNKEEAPPDHVRAACKPTRWRARGRAPAARGAPPCSSCAQKHEAPNPAAPSLPPVPCKPSCQVPFCTYGSASFDSWIPSVRGASTIQALSFSNSCHCGLETTGGIAASSSLSAKVSVMSRETHLVPLLFFHL